MRLNEQHVKTLFKFLDGGKKVSNLSYKEEDISNLAYTINAINAADKDAFLVGNFNINDYEFPEEWKGLVQPSEILIASDLLAMDLRNRANYQNKNAKGFVKGKILSPLEFKLKWVSILRSYKAPETFKKVKDLRGSKVMTDAYKNVTTSNELCLNNGYEIPYVITVEFYHDTAYNVSTNDLFEKFVASKILG